MSTAKQLAKHVDVRRLLEHYNFDISNDEGNYVRSACAIHGGKREDAFVANMENGLWTCHTNCGSGDVYTLVQAMEEISFVESLQWVANFFGVELEELEVLEAERKSEAEVQRWIRTVKAMRKKEIPCYESPDNAKRVTKFRTFDKETLEYFGIIHADEVPVVRKDGTSTKLRNRIGIPIRSDGKQIGMSFRRVRNKDNPKWMHQPTNIQTRELLYNYDNAIGKEYVVVVEGITDTWAWHELGIPAVATFGAHLSTEQRNLLIKSGANIVLCYDGDDAGREATRTAYEKLMYVANVEVIHLADGEDPDNITREELMNYYEIKRCKE